MPESVDCDKDVYHPPQICQRATRYCQGGEADRFCVSSECNFDLGPCHRSRRADYELLDAICALVSDHITIFERFLSPPARFDPTRRSIKFKSTRTALPPPREIAHVSNPKWRDIPPRHGKNRTPRYQTKQRARHFVWQSPAY